MVNNSTFARRMDQAHRLRQLVAQAPAASLSRRTQVIAVTSGKGGVGKTQLAVNLSIALAARRYRAILFDMDMGLANADLVLGAECRRTWAELLDGRRALEEVVVQGPGEIAFVPGATGMARLANLSEFERHQLSAAMNQIEGRYDVAVLDCGAGISRNVLGFAAQADVVLVVTTPEPTAVTDAYAMIKALAWDREQERCSVPVQGTIGVIVNMAESRWEGRQTFERLAGVAARFLHLPINDYGYILRDEHVPAAVRQRCPVVLQYPRCSASACLLACAARLAREMGQPEASPSLFYRVMNMFL